MVHNKCKKYTCEVYFDQQNTTDFDLILLSLGVLNVTQGIFLLYPPGQQIISSSFSSSSVSHCMPQEKEMSALGQVLGSVVVSAGAVVVKAVCVQDPPHYLFCHVQSF